MLDPARSLRAYSHVLHGIHPLTREAEQLLAIACRQGDLHAGKKLVEAALPFVVRVARQYRRWGVPMEDLIQQGNLGLLRAASKFDPERHVRFITYAGYWVRAEIRDYVVRNYRVVRLGTTRSERKAMRLYRRMHIESPLELADVSGMPKRRAEALWAILSRRDVPLEERSESGMMPLDRLRSDTPTPEEIVSKRADHERVRSALGKVLGRLPARERRIVEARVLRDEPVTLESLGQELGVTKERVRQLEQRAHGKLRAELADLHVAA